jgi:hypothetical protein
MLNAFLPNVRRSARALLVAVCLTVAIPSAAQAACPTQPTKQVFRAFGDSAYYALAPGGSFEAGTSAWTHTGSSVVLGNESYFLNAPTDTRSLQLPAKAYAVSPAFCVGMEHPTLRLMLRKVSGTGGKLKVEILFPDGRLTSVKIAGTVANIGQYASWAPSPSLDLANVLPFKSATQTMNVRLRVTADLAGPWAVDDVFIDPYRR